MINSNYTLNIEKLNKSFAKKVVLQDINLQLKSQTIYGLFGRNGAGKSTLLNILGNRIFPTNANISIDVAGSKAVFDSGLLYLTNDQNLFGNDKRLRDILAYTNAIQPNFDLNYAQELMAKFQLNDKKKMPKLSTGYATIFKNILALAANTPFVFYDEPILGLDANHRNLFYSELIRNFEEQPKTIVISTHLIDEVANILDEIILIKDKTIAYNEQIESFINKGYAVSGPTNDVQNFVQYKNVIHTTGLGNYMVANVYTEEKTDLIDDLPEALEILPLSLQELVIHLCETERIDI